MQYALCISNTSVKTLFLADNYTVVWVVKLLLSGLKG
nr:MAG TPA: hypothetical protein [Herelleviridae sp.]